MPNELNSEFLDLLNRDCHSGTKILVNKIEKSGKGERNILQIEIKISKTKQNTVFGNGHLSSTVFPLNTFNV